MKMDAEQGCDLIIYAINTDQKERLYNQWLHDPARYQINFSEYMSQATPYRKSTDAEKENILSRFGGD